MIVWLRMVQVCWYMSVWCYLAILLKFRYGLASCFFMEIYFFLFFLINTSLVASIYLFIFPSHRYKHKTTLKGLSPHSKGFFVFSNLTRPMHAKCFEQTCWFSDGKLVNSVMCWDHVYLFVIRMSRNQNKQESKLNWIAVRIKETV